MHILSSWNPLYTHEEIELTIAGLNVAAPGWDEITLSILLSNSISKYLIEPHYKSFLP